jgi:hypothetical protein
LREPIVLTARPDIPEYWPSVIEIKDVEPLPNGGARMTGVYKMAGVRLEIESQCTEFVRNRQTTYESGSGASSRLIWTCEPHDGGTKVTVENEYTLKMPVLRRLGESFLAKINENEAEVILAYVKAKMEA